jgi:hypothetical protein
MHVVAPDRDLVPSVLVGKSQDQAMYQGPQQCRMGGCVWAHPVDLAQCLVLALTCGLARQSLLERR